MKKFLVFASALVLVLGLNASSVFAATGVWTIDGVTDYITGVNEISTNNVSYFNSDSSNYCYTFWSQDGTDEVAQIYQTVEITEAGTYTLSFYYMGGPDSNGPISVYGYVGDNIGESVTSSGWIEDPEMWDIYTMSVDLEAGSYDVGAVVDLTATNAWGDLDNFTLTDADGNEYLVMGDFGFEDADWSTYIVSNVQDASAVSTDDTEEETEAVEEETEAEEEAEEEVEEETEEEEESSSAGLYVIIVILIIIVVVLVIYVLNKKKSTPAADEGEEKKEE